MAECGRCREARFARMNCASVFGCKPRQIQNFGLGIALLKDFLGDFQEPPALRHLARAGVLRARGAIYQEDARRTRLITAPDLRIEYRPFDLEAIDGELVVRIGEV